MRVNKFKIISLLGAPCSGKGTFAKKYCYENNFVHVSTGDIFRQHINNNTELGKQAQSYVETGLLCPDELGFKIILDFVNNNQMNIVLDGFPRTINDYLFLKENNIEIDQYFYFDIKDDILIERSQSRWIHPSSGRSYHIKNNPPKKEFIDDITGEPLTQRKEDKLEVFLKRLNIFKEKTMPLVELIQKNEIQKVKVIKLK